jgi:predicted O-methyltransferase YrrM
VGIDDLNFLTEKMSAGSVSIGDWETLIHYARGKKHVVELGTNIGTTAMILSLCAEKVCTVDVFEKLDLIENEKQREMYKNHWQSNRHEHRNIAAKLSFYRNIFVIQGLSYKAASFIECNGLVDLIFIDADHSYEGVKKDFEAWYPKIKTGGFFAFHDVGTGCQVFDYYNNELLKDPRISLMPDVATGPCWTKVFIKL